MRCSRTSLTVRARRVRVRPSASRLQWHPARRMDAGERPTSDLYSWSINRVESLSPALQDALVAHLTLGGSENYLAGHPGVCERRKLSSYASVGGIRRRVATMRRWRTCGQSAAILRYLCWLCSPVAARIGWNGVAREREHARRQRGHRTDSGEYGESFTQRCHGPSSIIRRARNTRVGRYRTHATTARSTCTRQRQTMKRRFSVPIPIRGAGAGRRTHRHCKCCDR